jgi:hypothetical protein
LLITSSREEFQSHPILLNGKLSMETGKCCLTVNIENIDIGSAKLFQALFHRNMHAFMAVSSIVYPDRNIVSSALVTGGIFRCNDELITNATLFSPLADYLFRCFMLIDARGITRMLLMQE